MGFARTYAVALLGLNGHMVEVEADIGQTLPAFVLLGLPDTALMESRERIRAAAKNSGTPLANRKITVSLTPATLPKSGTGFDLAILMAALQAAGEVPGTGRWAYLAELGLDGGLRPVPGVFPAVAAAVGAGHRRVVVARENLAEARLVPGAEVRGCASVADVLEEAGSANPGLLRPPAHEVPAEEPPEPRGRPDMAEIVGQAAGRWALEIAAAGGHHLSMVGPPGSGKTMLAERLPGILPPLDATASHEVTAVHSLGARRSRLTRLMTEAPWEAPHHTASTASLVGGGSGMPQPGAASRAHRGVLFLDEAPEFRRGVLDALRQPLESGEITVDRARASARYPARFQLVLAANPCPCGLSTGMGDRCTCSAREKRSYLGRLSGPLMDRIDLHLNIPKLSYAEVTSTMPGEATAEVAARVALARQAARERLAPLGVRSNAELAGTQLRGPLRPSSALLAPLHRLIERGALTVRGSDRVQRVAWSIADLEGASSPGAEHLEAAIALRLPAGAPGAL